MSKRQDRRSGSILDTVKAEGRTALTAPEGKLVCDAYGIAGAAGRRRDSRAAEAAKLAAGMGFPVVLKIVSPEILHKTEAGGVLVGVKSADGRRAGLRHDHRQREEVQRQGERSSASRCSRCSQGGQEVIIGAVTDPSFGKLVAFGLGGVLVEVLKDITFRLAPATQGRRAVDARRHRRRPRC